MTQKCRPWRPSDSHLNACIVSLTNLEAAPGAEPLRRINIGSRPVLRLWSVAVASVDFQASQPQHIYQAFHSCCTHPQLAAFSSDASTSACTSASKLSSLLHQAVP